MYYTYILLCKRDKEKKFYIGSTDDLRERVLKHRTKSVKTTKAYNQIILVYYEACRNKTDARRRELQLKTGFGRSYLKNRLKNDEHLRA